MSDDRPTRPSRPRISVPAFATAPLSKPFALLSNTISAVDRIVRRHVEPVATFAVGSAPLSIVASREADLVRLLVRVVADAVLTLPVPRDPDAVIALEVRREPRDAVVVVEVRGRRRDTQPPLPHEELQPTLEDLATIAIATIAIEADQPRVRRTAVRIPLAVPLEAMDDDSLV
jgi:hypothetical protein